jgi:uncharacterized membrane protein
MVLHRTKLAVIVVLFVIISTLPQSGGALLAVAQGVGFAVCHQLPEHSLHMDGQQLPLCARCTGIYLGFLVGLLGLALQGKLRASTLPSWSMVGILLSSFVLMGLDGFNSLQASFGEAPQWYQSTNLLRLATGTAAGVSLALLMMPLLNDALWAEPDRSASVDDLGDLVGYAILASLVVALANSEHPAMLFPSALAGAAGVIAALSVAGATLASTLLGRKIVGVAWAHASRPLSAGLALAIFAIALVGGARAYFSLPLGL